MAKQRVGRRKAICLDCGHEWWALEGKEKPPRCTMHGCRSRNVVWSDTLAPGEMKEIENRARSQILALGGQSQPAEPKKVKEPEPEPQEPPKAEQKKDEEMKSAEDIIDDFFDKEEEPKNVTTTTTITTNPPSGTGGTWESTRTSTSKEKPSVPKHTKRTASGKFAPKDKQDKQDKDENRTDTKTYSSFEDAVNDVGNYRGFNPIFILILGGIALIGAFIFLRGKTGILAPKKEVTIIETQESEAVAEPIVEQPYFGGGVRVGGGGLF